MHSGSSTQNDQQTIPLVQHPANDVLLGWTPDGAGIVLGSDRRGTHDIVALRFAEGTAVGMQIAFTWLLFL